MTKYFKFIFLTLFFSCVFVSVFAQKFSVGIQTGVNSSKYDNGSERSKELLGLNVGSVFIYNPTQRIGFSLESSYSQQGNVWDNGENRLFERLNYFRNSILLNYTFFKENKAIRPILQAGFYHSYLLNSHSDIDYGDGFYNSTNTGGVLKVGVKTRIYDKLFIIPNLSYYKDFNSAMTPDPRAYMLSSRIRTWSGNISFVYGLSKMKN
jgi:outer membrane protein W